MNEVTTLRLKMLENGWTPLRNVDKATYMKGWPDLDVTVEEVMSWDRITRDQATGIRIENGLVAVDIDVDDDGIVEALADALMDIVPALELADTPWLERNSGKAKVAWFFRTDEPFGKLKTAVFVPPGFKPDDPDAPTGFIEVFGGGSARQFGAFGPHSHEGRKVIREYGWGERSPLDTRLEELPVITKAQFVELSARAADIMKAAGWTIQPLTKFSDHAGGRLFDLPEDGTFHCIDGVSRSLAELQAAAGGRDPLRCSMSWKEGPQAKNRTRGLVGLTKGGMVFVHDTQDAVTHLPASEKPTTTEQDVAKQTTEEVVKTFAEKAKAISPSRMKIRHDDDHDTALAKFVQLYAYCPTSPLPVVPIHPEATNGEGAMTVANARLLMLPHAMEIVGPRGGVQKVSVVDSWLNSDRLVKIAGVRMMPGEEVPLFRQEGATYINRYRAPDHSKPGGSPDVLIRFMARLIPDDAEREWLLDRVAHKLAHPEIPGPATVFVAHKVFGTGRGTFFRLLRQLIGVRYHAELPFSDFMGKTYQSQYNDWAGTALIACINESADAEDGGGFRQRRSAYEHIKEIVEPRPHAVSVKVKTLGNYTAMSTTSFFIATNHADALPIPEEDRRISVLTNGPSLSVEEAEEFNAAVDDMLTVSAFYRWLLARGWGSFLPYSHPPIFEAKRRMIDLGRSDIDDAWADALTELPEVFTAEAVKKAIMKAAHESGAELPGGATSVIKHLTRKELFRVGIRDGRNWTVRIDGRKHSVYCRTSEDAQRWTKVDAEALRAALELPTSAQAAADVRWKRS